VSFPPGLAGRPGGMGLMMTRAQHGP
jgi:hypothetical protein